MLNSLSEGLRKYFCENEKKSLTLTHLLYKINWKNKFQFKKKNPFFSIKISHLFGDSKDPVEKCIMRRGFFGATFTGQLFDEKLWNYEKLCEIMRNYAKL